MSKIWRAFAMLALLALPACNLPAMGATPTLDPGAIFTAAAQTVEAQLTQSALINPPTATETPPPPTDTPLAATDTPLPTATNTASPTPLPCNAARFVTDVNYPDGTTVTANTTFTKTWRLQNVGSCTWTSGYKLVFDHGDSMNAPAETTLTTGTVPPGATVDISVELKAPSTPGTYKGYFKLRSPEGIVFGLGASAQNPFWVEIVVPAVAQPDLIITAMTFSDDPVVQGDPFTVTVKVKNQGTADAGAFSVQWWSSWAVVSCNWTVPSLAAGAQTTLTCDYTYGGWANYTVKAVADSGNLVAESNEGNNELSQTLSVHPAP